MQTDTTHPLSIFPSVLSSQTPSETNGNPAYLATSHIFSGLDGAVTFVKKVHYVVMGTRKISLFFLTE